MYHSIIHIDIFSKSGQLEELLKQLPPLEKFEYCFDTFESCHDMLTSEADVIILDLPYDNQVMNMVMRNKKEGKLLVLCISPEEAAALTAEDYGIIDEIWLKPVNAVTATFYFSKLMRQIKLSKELWLCRKYLDTAIDSIPDMLWFKDLSGAHLKVNDSFCRAVGKTKEDIKGQSHYYIWDISKEEYDTGEYVCLDTDEIVLKEKKLCLFNENVKSRDGMRQLITYKAPILDDNGEPIGTVGIARDVTDLLNIKAELEIVLEHIPFALLFYNNSGEVLSANKSFEEYFNINKTDIIGKKYDKLAASMFSDYTGDCLDTSCEAKTYITGDEKIIRVYKEPVYDIFKNITGYFCVYSDITMEQRMQERIIHSANTDYLTGLYNRRYLYENINSIRNENRGSFLYVDLDDFKLINDRFGHKAGDKVLVAVAEILRELFSDQTVFRLGGDEFLVAFSDDYDMEKIKAAASAFLDRMKNGIPLSDTTIELSASIGVVLDIDASVDFEELLKYGDASLYKAKQEGKNKYCIWPV